jgi:hypothetical protein
MEKSLCPIHYGGFLSAMLAWFNLIIRPKKGKTTTTHMYNCVVKNKKCVAT